MNAGVDLLIVSPKEAAPLTPVLASAFRQGIPVIVLDRKVLGHEFTQFIGADNRRIGRAAGDWIVRRLSQLEAVKKGRHARVVELKGLVTSTPAQERGAGFEAALKGQPIDLVFAADMKWLEPEARQEMESALATNDHIDLVFAHNDPGAHGAYLAAKAASREKEMLFVGVDGLPQEGQAYVRQGILSASFEYPTGGQEAIASALTLLHGGTVPQEVVLNSRYFTADTVAHGGTALSQPQSISSASPSP